MTSSLVTLAAEETHVVNELPMPPYMYGVVALAILLFLLMVTVAYRNIHTRNH